MLMVKRCEEWADKNETLFTSSDEEDVEYVEEEYGQVESNSEDACEVLDKEDEGFSEPNLDVDLSDVYSSTSNSDDDEGGVIDVNKNFKGKRFQYDDNKKVKQIKLHQHLQDC